MIDRVNAWLEDELAQSNRGDDEPGKRRTRGKK